jgi:hypothetical protein
MGGTIDSLGSFFGSISIDSGVSTTVTGSVTSAADISISSGIDTVIEGTLTADGSVDLLGTPTIVAHASNLYDSDFTFDFVIDAGTDITIEATEFLEVQGQFNYGGGEFVTFLDEPVVLEGGGTAFFNGETGEYTVE